MNHSQQFYIDREWVDPHGSDTTEVINPATEKPIATIALGDSADVDAAVAAARRAFPSYSSTNVKERGELLARIIESYQLRMGDLASVLTEEMGAPGWLASAAQVPAGLGHFMAAAAALDSFEFEVPCGTTTLAYEAVGVCALITPWNWPLNQIAAKLAPALAAGCTVVLKPSEVAPLNALLLAEILHDAGVPTGVFNLVNGDGPGVGAALASHRDVDMVSFTGSTRAGVEIARSAAPSVKRVTQELGGKSASILLDDADFPAAVARDVGAMFVNSGQTCTATSRLLVPLARMAETVEIARTAAKAVTVGPPDAEGTIVGPVVSEAQYDRIQGHLKQGVEEGANLVCGGLGRPEGLETGFYVQPTIFADVTRDMAIAREEIFGPVLVIMGYSDDDEAVEIANDSDYGLAGAVSSGDPDRARSIAHRLRTGMVHINGAPADINAPFGGYKQSGNGREFGVHGLREYLEVKSIFGDGV